MAVYPTLWMSEALDDALVDRRELTILQERAVTGDRAAFEQIWIRHERRIVTVAFRLLGRLEDAQDVAQEIFIRASRYLHRFDPKKPIEPWLIRMTVNVCRTASRKRRMTEHLFVDVDPQFVDRSASRDPHTELAEAQQRELLHRALAELPERERAAIVLRDIEGFSTAEVAEILGSSEATVRVQLSSARIKVKNAIERKRRPV
jgi:RNA polymerase sigma-70 factor (ECF subfamily)